LRRWYESSSGWREIFGEYAQWHSDKTAKTGFVGFGSTYLGDYREFLGGIFLGFTRVVGAIRKVTFFFAGIRIQNAGKKFGNGPYDFWWA